MFLTLVALFLPVLAAPWLVRALGRASGWVLALVPLAVSAYFFSFLEFSFLGRSAGELPLRVSLPWVPGLDLALSLQLDGLSLLFALLITGIGTLVVIYAGGYLAGHARLGLFFAYLFLFMGSMLGLVLADNLLTLFIFWELTSLSSYLLIGFEHERAEARAAALQALLVTGAGGLALMAGLLLLGLTSGTFEISAMVSGAVDLREHGLYTPILLLIVAGAFTKSAQFPFHFWLPNAMEAPTPVSAYLHSATMVKAGVYLLARMHPVLGGTETWFYVLATGGALTTLLGAWLAYRATDLKKILAYSTLSILGALTLLLGIGGEQGVTAAMVVLLGHGLYKGALFLVAGGIDHAAHQRDIRHLGGLWRAMPLTTTAAILAGLSMAGVASTFGFLGKELYYEAAAPPVLLGAAVIASALVAAAAGMVCFLPFFGSRTEAARHAHEGGPALWLGPAVLAALGLVLGLAPYQTAQQVVAASSAVVLGEPVTVKLALWHGFTPTLALSLATLAGGLALYVLRTRLAWLDRLLEIPARCGPAQLYQRALEFLAFAARWQTRFLQNGYLRYYLLTTVGVTMVLVWGALRTGLNPDFSPEDFDIHSYEVLMAALILPATLFVVLARSRLAAIAGLGVVGYSMGGIFVLGGAPDLAMTQFVVETLTVILFVLVFYHLPNFRRYSSLWVHFRDALLSLFAGGTLTILLLVANGAMAHDPISDYFVRNSVTEAHGRNLVNVILVDFRALDTLGEITVLAIAGVGVYALLKLRLPGGAPVPSGEGSPAVEKIRAADGERDGEVDGAEGASTWESLRERD